MPNLTFFISSDAMPAEDQLMALTDECSQLCVTGLAAVPTTVHVIYVPVRQGLGQPVFAQLDYRLVPFRQGAVMDSFMAALDAAIRRHTGMVARIRCFGHPPCQIHARG